MLSSTIKKRSAETPYYLELLPVFKFNLKTRIGEGRKSITRSILLLLAALDCLAMLRRFENGSEKSANVFYFVKFVKMPGMLIKILNIF
jgi:hypothetical protein